MTGAASISKPDRRRPTPGGRALGPRVLVDRVRSSLRSRLLAGALGLVLVADLASAVSFYYQQRQHSITETIVDKGRQMHHLSDFQFEVGQIATRPRPLTAADVSALRANRRAYDRTVRDGATPAQRALLRQVAPQLEALVAARRRFDRLRPGARGRAAARTRVLARAAALAATMAQSHELLDMRMDAADVSSRERAAGAVRAFVAGTAVATLGALMLALVLANRISAPVLRLAAGARELAGGRLRHRLTVDSTDEIGTLAREFNQMATQVEEAQTALERRVAERTRELADANRELEEHRLGQERLAAERRTLLGRVIAVQEDERTRIARELHDEAGQSLTALRLGVEAAGTELRAGRIDDCSARLEALSDAASDALTDLERLVLDLRPAQLDHLGLVATLRWYVRRFDTRTPTTTELEISGRVRRLDRRVETALFRIVQEALTNVARHSGAGHATVSARFSPVAVAVEVRDDGIGFDSSAAHVSPTSVGLLGMREHAELVGGSLTVSSSPGRGTRVSAVVPFAEAPR